MVSSGIMMDVHYLDMKDIKTQAKRHKEKIGFYAEVLGVDKTKLRLTDNNYLFYVEEGKFAIYCMSHFVDLDLQSTPNDAEVLDNFTIKNFKKRIKHCIELYDNGEHNRLYGLLEQREILVCVESMMKSTKLTNDEKWYHWLNAYKHLEYNHEYMLKHFKPELITETNKDKLTLNNKGLVSVYRGMTDKSTPIKKSLSWTTDINIAIFFANRYTTEYAEIVEGLVNPNDIYYYDTSGESEVLVDGSTVKVSKTIKANGTKQLTEDLKNKKVDEGYNYITLYGECIGLIDDNEYHDPNGIHGVLHVKRVILHNLVLSMLYKLPFKDVELLIMSAVYHDVARTHNEECLIHGEKAVKYLDNNGLSKTLYSEYDAEYEKIFDFIVTYHCKEDKEGYDFLEKSDIKDKKRTKRLFNIFKDADALDRVRFGGLDVKYLRNDKSLVLKQFAHDVVKNIK